MCACACLFTRVCLCMSEFKRECVGACVWACVCVCVRTFV